VGDIIEEIAFKVRQAYEVRYSYVKRRQDFQQKFPTAKPNPSYQNSSHLRTVKTTDKIICIGSSTGGTVALEYLVQKLPANLPPVLIVQHMPPNFTKQFAQRLNGTVYVAPGGLHLTLERRGVTLYTKLTTTERVQYQRPSADVLFRSAAEVSGQNVVAALLTGMGRDGAEGLLKLLQSGAHTIAQDEATSVVWGMPRAAIELGAAKEVLGLDKIAPRIVEACLK
jgi:two-component system chemotaxis response regulator CheB